MPQSRVNHCAVMAVGEVNGMQRWQVYIHGGQNLDQSQQYSDTWVLSGPDLTQVVLLRPRRACADCHHNAGGCKSQTTRRATRLPVVRVTPATSTARSSSSSAASLLLMHATRPASTSSTSLRHRGSRPLRPARRIRLRRCSTRSSEALQSAEALRAVLVASPEAALPRAQTLLLAEAPELSEAVAAEVRAAAPEVGPRAMAGRPREAATLRRAVRRLAVAPAKGEPAAIRLHRAAKGAAHRLA